MMNSAILNVQPMNADSDNMTDRMNTNVQLRPLPYPYRAMLAICSDLDETPNRRVYHEITRFLNTTKETAMGPGIGLEVGNSIYFDMPGDQFAYWNTDDAGRQMVRALIQSGHIDCLHSYGDLATTRKEAARALDELDRHNCKMEVWIDHGIAATNFDSTIMQGHGDEIGHEAYHSDLTLDYGVKYVWRARVTSVIGQDIPRDLNGVFNWTHPVKSGQTLLKEAVKGRLARRGDRKYAMHGPNETLRRTVLRDNSPVYEFLRCNPHWGGVDFHEQGRYLGETLTEGMLKRLISREGTCIFYTHLGKKCDPEIPFGKAAVKGLYRLARAFETGRVLVTTTRRLLGYGRAKREITFDSTQERGGLRIDLDTRSACTHVGPLSPSDLYGLTFYVPDLQATSMTIDGHEVRNLQRNAADHTGRPSVSLPWPALEFPDI